MPKRNKSSSEIKGRQREEWYKDVTELIKRMYGSNTKQDSHANNLISSSLDVIFSKIVQKVMESNPIKPTIEDIQRAVNAVVSPELAHHATSEAAREIFLWGAMPFDFVPSKKNLKAYDKYVSELEKLTKKAKDELNQSFANGIMALSKDYHPKMQMEKGSKNYMCLLLDNVIDEIVQKMKNSNPEQLTLNGAQHTIQDVLPPNIANHANAEGTRMLTRFANHGYKFVPEMTTRDLINEITSARDEEERQRRSFKANGVEFKNGVLSILKEINAKGDIDEMTHKNLCQNLDELFYLIFEQIGDERVTHEAIHDAIHHVLPPLMAEHAAAEASKKLDQQEMGHLGFGRPSQILVDASDEIDMELEDGIAALIQEHRPEAKLHRMGQNRISFDLKRLVNAVIGKMKEAGTRNVSPYDVQQAVEAVFGESSLTEHAKSEGGKYVAMEEMGELKFVPNKKRSK